MFARFVFFFVLISVCVAADPDQPSTMKKMVTRLTSEATKSDPAAAHPKTFFRAGKKYSRLEEERDANNGMHRLIITNEPESWVINLEDQTGKHYLDKGPEFMTKVPIFWGLDGKPERDFEGLEFGEEKDFFGKGRARDLGTRKVEGRTCKALSIVSGQNEVILYLEKKTDRPYQIDLIKFGRPAASVRYLSYESDVPFDASLFEPPKTVMMMPGERE